MSKIQNFNKYLNENLDKDEEKRLREFGISNISNMPYRDRVEAMTDEWGSDPDVIKALDLLKSKTNEIIDKWIDYDDDADEIQADQEAFANEYSLDELGFLEFMIASGNL